MDWWWWSLIYFLLTGMNLNGIFSWLIQTDVIPNQKQKQGILNKADPKFNRVLESEMVFSDLPSQLTFKMNKTMKLSPKIIC